MGSGGLGCHCCGDSDEHMWQCSKCHRELCRKERCQEWPHGLPVCRTCVSAQVQGVSAPVFCTLAIDEESLRMILDRRSASGDDIPQIVDDLVTDFAGKARRLLTQLSPSHLPGMKFAGRIRVKEETCRLLYQLALNFDVPVEHMLRAVVHVSVSLPCVVLPLGLLPPSAEPNTSVLRTAN